MILFVDNKHYRKNILGVSDIRGPQHPPTLLKQTTPLLLIQQNILQATILS